MSKRCEEEKTKFLNTYDCYDYTAIDSLAEVLHIIPYSDFPHYDETPDSAVIFAGTGCDGCHYCMVEDKDEINVYLICPNMDDDSIHLIGHSVSEVLSYALSINGLFESVFDLSKDSFLQEVDDSKREWSTELNSD